MIFLTRKQQLQHRFDITNNPIAHKSLQNVFFEVTKGCMGSLEFLGLNDRVRDGVRNRAKVQLTGDFPPSTPHKRSKVTVGLTRSDSIQTHTSLSCEPSLQQQTSRYATYRLTGITLALYCISMSSVAHLHVSKSTRFQCCSQHPRILGQVSKT